MRRIHPGLIGAWLLFLAPALLAADPLAELRAKAVAGDVDAQFNLGLMYSVGIGAPKNGGEAVTWFRKAADQGNKTAQFKLGVILETGDGVPRDPGEAVKWYLKAAEQDVVFAQYNLGTLYHKGDGVRKDSAEAVKWWLRAAMLGDARAQGFLGGMYANGTGVPKDAIEGLAWSNISAAAGNDVGLQNRNRLETQLGPEVTLAAQQRSKQISQDMAAGKRVPTPAPAVVPAVAGTTTSPAVAAPAPVSTPFPVAPPAPVVAVVRDPVPLVYHVAEPPKSSGSGAVVSAEGHILTAAHVVTGASRIQVSTARGTKSAEVLRIDEANDIAVLKMTGESLPALSIAPSRKMRLGQTVATIGFPHIDVQGSSPKVTKGEISSLNGIADDPRAWQISVPVQAGNSGGPLLDESGNLVGVVVSKLGVKAMNRTGDLLQNVGYAVKSAYAVALLEPYVDVRALEASAAERKLSLEDMVAKVQQSVVLILVY